MKTVAVLAALAAVATAVPALPGYYGRYIPHHQRLLTVNREKKSPQLESFDTAPAALAAPAVPIDDVIIPSDFETSARTIGLKKPIIVKKKFGYHLYRDSAEEQAQADPQEKCTKQVKVKLCDAENLHTKSDKMRAAAEDTSAEITESDMKNSIKMAKEAVENLQKLTQFKNANMGPDAELHDDIEVARQALEHIQQNFGNLEEMNVHATTLTDAKALQKARFSIAKTDEAKMAQWKEAIDNIQKNAELARNIEDSFISVDQSGIPSVKSDSMKAVPNSDLHLKSKLADEKAANPETSIKEHDENVKEMMPSASEHQEMRAALDGFPVQAKDAMNLENLKVEANADKPTSGHIEQEKNAEFDTSLHAPVTSAHEKAANEHESTKPAEFVTETKKEDQTMQAKASEIMDMESDLALAQSAPEMKAVPAPDLSGHPADNTHLVQHKSSWMEDKEILAKASEDVPVSIHDMKVMPIKKEHEKSAELETMPLTKPVDALNNQDKHLNGLTDIHMQAKDAEKIVKPNDHQANINLMNDNQELSMQAKLAALTPAQRELISKHMKIENNHASELNRDHASQTKSADAALHTAQLKSSHMDHPTTLEKNPAMNFNQDHMNHMKAAESTPHQSELMLANMGPSNGFENNQATSFNQDHLAHMKAAESVPLPSELKTIENNQDRINHMKSAESTPNNSELMSSHMGPVKGFGNTQAMTQNHGSLMKSADLPPRHQSETMSSHMPHAPSVKNTEMNPEMRAADFNTQEGFGPQSKMWHADEMPTMTSKSFQNAEFERTAPLHPGHMGHQFEGHVGPHMHAHHHQHFDPHGHHHMHGHLMPQTGFHGMHGKASDGDSAVQAATQVNVNDVSGKSVMDHSNNLMQWKQKEAARGAYGAGAYGAGGLSAGAASGPGAVGVFPGASVGGCAIPLLLSCSPSVVSGSLAKVPSYGAHAYRANDDFNDRFHNKRDTTKTKDKITAKVKRTPTKVIQKIPLDKKL